VTLSGREARVFECLADAVLAPAPPLPPVRETDACAAFAVLLAAAPAPNRLALRAILLALAAARWPRRAPPARLALLARLARSPAAPLVEAVRATAAVAYYGDRGVQRRLGYDP